MIVYHGTKDLYGKNIYCPAIYYELRRGSKLSKAMDTAERLYESLTDYSDLFLLQRALDDAQTTSIKSPFISTTKIRDVARSFALNAKGQGYIYTIEGPENDLYDFNKVRQINNLPAHKTFNWMEELGIKFEITKPFEVVRIERIIEVKEEIELIFEK